MLFLSEAVSEETGLRRAGWFRSVFGLQNTLYFATLKLVLKSSDLQYDASSHLSDSTLN